MNHRPVVLALVLAAAPAGAQELSAPDPEATAVRRVDSRFEVFAGSSANLESLVHGLRRGTEIELSGGGETVVLQPPTKPMGHGNVTRTLDLASRQLSSVGIVEPTPQEIRAALTGGTVSTPDGEVVLQGVLPLRSAGMGWGQIAQTLGVHPGMRAARAAPMPAVGGGSGITTAAGAPAVRTANGAAPNRHAAKPAGRSPVAGGGAGLSHPLSGASRPAGAGRANGLAHAQGRGLGRN